MVSSSTTRIVRAIRAGSSGRAVNASFTAVRRLAPGRAAAASRAIAASSRASVRSRPRATSVSNSGGVAVRPVVATRIAMNRSPAFQPRASTSSRSGGSSSSASQVVAVDARRGARGRRASPSAVVAASQRLGTSSGRVDVELVDPQEADEVDDRGERRQPLADQGQQRADLVLGGVPVDLRRRRRGLEERQQPIDEVVVVEAPDPLPVEPLEPLAVEPGAALLDLLELEPLDDLVEREARPPPCPGDQPRNAK